MNDGLANTNVTSLVTDSTSGSSVLYAGTSGYFVPGRYVPAAGIFKSSDGGMSWQPTSADEN
jgi:hypothetical protein